MESPYANRESESIILAASLAERLRSLGNGSVRGAAPGSISGLEQPEIDEFAGLIESNLSGTAIKRHYLSYGEDLSGLFDGNTRSGKIGILLRGVVEVQAPFENPNEGLSGQADYYAVTVLRPPALIGLFEAIKDARIPQHRIKIVAGTQSFAVLLSLSQHAPWEQIAKRGSVTLDWEMLRRHRSLTRHTQLFKWVKGGRAPAFNSIASGQEKDWMIEVAVIDVDAIVNGPFKALSSEQQLLRDTLFRAAIRQFGSSLVRHAPGYREGPPEPHHIPKPVSKILPVASVVQQVHTGEQAHHTACTTFEDLCYLLPAKTLVWNIYDFIRLSGGQKIDLSRFGTVRRLTNEPLEADIIQRFFEEYLIRYVYVPSFTGSKHVCLYSPQFWPHDENYDILDGVDPAKVKALRDFLLSDFGMALEELCIHNRTRPKYFEPSSAQDTGVPGAIADAVMNRAVFMRKA